MSNNHLNTNRQFMIGNGILAFAIIFVVVIFVYMSLRLKSEKENGKQYSETYNIELVRGFIGDSISIYVNDSLLMNKKIDKDSIKLSINRFAEESALLVVDNFTDKVSTFSLREIEDNVFLRKENNMILQERE